jgi:crotonobetainyl-CoA:carnitine CoA-transferase CaiB-like acyl-CoA transferase
MVAILRSALLETQLDGRAEPPANRHTDFFPSGHYRCASEDSWIAVTARTDRERGALGALVGSTDTLDSRALDDALVAWAAQLDVESAWTRLRDAGVPAMPVNSLEALYASQWARSRELTVPIDHELLGRQEMVRLPWVVNGHTARPRSGAPLLGHDGDQILQELLTLSTQDIERLRAAGALE